MEFYNYELITPKAATTHWNYRNDIMDVVVFLNILSILFVWLAPKSKLAVDGVPTSEYNKLVDDHNDLLREKTKLEEKNEQDVDDYNQLVEKHNSLLEQFEALQEKNEKDVDDYNQLVDQHNTLVEDYDELKQKFDDAEKRIARLESRINRWF